ncbi:ArsR family transcriptional regulator [Natrialbaceae archaeon A-CW3]
MTQSESDGDGQSVSSAAGDRSQASDERDNLTGGDSSDGSLARTETIDSSSAFQAVGHERRAEILENLLQALEDDGPSRRSFADLFAASSADTSAGFAYHLEQLVGPFLRKVEPDEASSNDADGRREPGYEFTYAGLKMARAIQTGAYTRRIDSSPIELDDPCPFCTRDLSSASRPASASVPVDAPPVSTETESTHEHDHDHEPPALEAQTADNVVTIACPVCDRHVLRLQFPPSGLESHGDDLPDAFDRHHRYRLTTMGDGVCPECGGDVVSRVASPSDAVDVNKQADAADDRDPTPPQVVHACNQCQHELRCPVTLSVLEHPSVISFYHDYGIDIRDRPLWNVGPEWAETVLSRDPLCVRVVAERDDDVLALYVDGTGRVVETQRSGSDPSVSSERI